MVLAVTRLENGHRPAIVPAVGVVCLKGEDVLLIRRGQPPLAGAWSLPGGRIEFGEPAEDAALRELKEETDITAELCGLIDVVDGVFTSRTTKETTRHYLLCDFAARWISGEPRAGDDAADAKFVPLDEIVSLDLWDETRRIIDVARTLV
ncbi:MAG: NUDIX hydrolase [Pseudomonadota bacterium]